MRHSYRVLEPVKVVRRVAVEDKKRVPLKNGKVSAQCANGKHPNCAATKCKCRSPHCDCRFNP